MIMYNRIRNLREDSDLAQKVLANYLSIHQAAYSKYELGQRNMTPEVLVKLAFFYNTSVDFLLGITDIKEPYPRSKKR